MTGMLFVGLGFGLGIALLLRSLLPTRRDLAATVGRWERARQAPRRSDGGSVGRRDRLGSWIASRLSRDGIDLTLLGPDLRITGRSLDTWLAGLVASACVGLVVPGALVAFAQAAGIQLSAEIGAAAGMLLAALAVALEVARLRSDAAARRAEMLAALATYLELFSMSLASGRGVPEAMLSSAKIGSGWTFEIITDTITRSRRTGETPWHALGRLGEELALTELVDLASALTLVGESGARVRASLAARSGTLRRRQLAEAAAEAAKNDDSMRVSQLLLAAGFMILIGYPAVLNVMAV